LRSLIAVSYDLVILDIQLEDKSGFAVMDTMATQKLDTQVIVVTGEESEKNAITALKGGAADYLKKLFKHHTDIGHIEHLWRAPANRRTATPPVPIIQTPGAVFDPV